MLVLISSLNIARYLKISIFQAMSVSTVYDDVVANVYEEDHEEGDKEDPTEEETTQHSKPRGDTGSQSSAKLPVAVVKHRAQPRKRPHPDEDMSKEEKLVSLRRQVEYYFSDKNLSTDAFFHEKISGSPQGWLDASWILGCNRVQKMKVTSDEEIESALVDSDLELQWLFGENSSGQSHKSLQVRRKLGKALPPLQDKCDSKGKAPPIGWLAQQVQQRASRTEQPEEVVVVKVPEVGATVRLISGEHTGESGQVVAVDGEDLTLLVGGDVVIASAREVEK